MGLETCSLLRSLSASTIGGLIIRTLLYFSNEMLNRGSPWGKRVTFLKMGGNIFFQKDIHVLEKETKKFVSVNIRQYKIIFHFTCDHRKKLPLAKIYLSIHTHLRQYKYPVYLSISSLS